MHSSITSVFNFGSSKPARLLFEEVYDSSETEIKVRRSDNIAKLIASEVPGELQEDVHSKAYKLLQAFDLDTETYQAVLAKVRGVMDSSETDPDTKNDDEAAILTLAKHVREERERYRSAIENILGKGA